MYTFAQALPALPWDYKCATKTKLKYNTVMVSILKLVHVTSINIVFKNPVISSLGPNMTICILGN